ncbi:MAG: hypothetical protein J3K34DRAFT_435957 [Monoraphidium minutum]|nr:MAG: hypothetical protein J3K34DRAFT_435957 [Monoraphidium minutum]
MRFRPWAGVFLSEDYLGSVAGAMAATRTLLAAYAEAGVVPIVETEIRRPQDMELVRELLEAAYGPGCSGL